MAGIGGRLGRGVALAAGLVFALAGAASATWQDELGTLRVGVAAGGDPTGTLARLQPFRTSLERSLGLPIQIYTARDYAGLIDALVGGRLEYAILSSSAYVTAQRLCKCVEPLVTARAEDGLTSYRMVLIARPGGPSGLTGLRGRRVGVTGSEAFGGNGLAERELAAAGVRLGSAQTPVERFATSDEAVLALRQGRIDALLGWSSLAGDARTGYSRGTFRRLLEVPEPPADESVSVVPSSGAKARDRRAAPAAAAAEQPAGPAGPVGEGGLLPARPAPNLVDYRLIWQSQPIPHRTHAVAVALDGEAKAALRRVVSALADEDPAAYDAVEPDYGGGFFIARQAMYEPLGRLMNPSPGGASERQVAPDSTDLPGPPAAGATPDPSVPAAPVAGGGANPPPAGAAPADPAVAGPPVAGSQGGPPAEATAAAAPLAPSTAAPGGLVAVAGAPAEPAPASAPTLRDLEDPAPATGAPGEATIPLPQPRPDLDGGTASTQR